MTDYRFKPKTTPDEFGWHRRGYLPHFDGPGNTQFITFRLCDSLPQTVLREWRDQLFDDSLLRKKIERYLDAGYGECWLRSHEVASVVREALLFHHGAKYELVAWVIMPNHVHLLLRPREGVHLPDILHSIKSYTAQKANRILGRSGAFWQRESFDRYIRNQKHFNAVIHYIEQNPVKAGLCATASEWRYSSAFGRN